MKVFLSYSWHDEHIASAVAEDVRLVGHTVWYDREITGGQAWWDAVLRQIRESELVIFILTPKSLDSQACRAECAYALRLQKRVLPVLCSDGVSVNLLPPELSLIQFVDYRAQDKQSAFAMVRALSHLPMAAPIPDPLPPEPPAPLSYLGDLRVQIEHQGELPLADQRDLVTKLKQRLKDAEARDDALKLLRLLRGREDLRVSVAEEIDVILKSGAQDEIPRVRFSCPSCFATMKAAASAVGRSVRCPKCKKMLVVPSPGDQPHGPHGGGAPHPATGEIDLAVGDRELEALIRHVVATSEGQVIEAEEGRMLIHLEGGSLLLALSCTSIDNIIHFISKNVKIKLMGWSQPRPSIVQIPQMAVGSMAFAICLFTAGRLARKAALDYIYKFPLRKRFSPNQEREAAASVVGAFRTLCPGTTKLVVSKEETLLKGERRGHSGYWGLG